MAELHRGLGRRVAHDDRDRLHLARARLPAKAPERQWRYHWNRGARLDQGQTGTCVGHGCVHLAENGPVTRRGTMDPFQLYREAILLDEWPENDWEATAPMDRLQFGTSVRAGMKALQARGLVSEYLWAWDLATAVDWVHRSGPIVLGTNWYYGMDQPDEKGVVRVSGGLAGGHCYVWDGVYLPGERGRFLNSWDWHVFWMSFADVERLILEDGEAAMATEIARAA
jgi:hypothetical protein